MEFQCKKYKDVNGVTLFIDYFTITFIRQKKVRAGWSIEASFCGGDFDGIE